MNTPTTNMHVLAERQRIAALEAELASTAPAHAPGNYWHDSRQEELALCKSRLSRLEKIDAALPQ